MGNSLATLSIAAALSVGNTQAEGLKSPDFSGLIESGNPAVTQVVHDTQARIAPLAQETSILVAQASQETNGKIYTVYVIQIDGSKKEVKYTKDATGIINPPEDGEDGKLLDGSPATSNPKLNRAKNRSILAKYDKDSQILVALVDKNDIIGKGKGYLSTLLSLAENNKPITKEQILDGFVGAYIYVNGGKNMDQTIQGIMNIGSIRLKMSNSEIEKLRQEGESKAQKMWVNATGALG